MDISTDEGFVLENVKQAAIEQLKGMSAFASNWLDQIELEFDICTNQDIKSFYDISNEFLDTVNRRVQNILDDISEQMNIDQLRLLYTKINDLYDFIAATMALTRKAFIMNLK